MTNKMKSGGFIKIIVVLIVIIIILAYFNINLREILTSEATRDNIEVLKGWGTMTWNLIVLIWNDYIKTPALWLWQEAILNWLWPLVSSWFQSQKSI